MYYARPAAAGALITEFQNTSVRQQPGLKWAIGNAVAVVTTPQHLETLLKLALDPAHGDGRQMIVDRIGRISGDQRVIDALKLLSTDEDVALHAMAGLRRRLGPAAVAAAIRPLTDHRSALIQRVARDQLKRNERSPSSGQPQA